MSILREYYGASFVQQPDAPEVHQSSRGAGASIIELVVFFISFFHFHPFFTCVSVNSSFF